MVSLSEDSNRSRGNFFEANKEDQENISDSSSLLLVVNAEQSNGVRNINTTWLIILQLLILIGVWLCAFILPVVCSENKCGVPSLSLIVYITGSVWFLQLIIDRYYRLQHYRNRLYGYLNFYRTTRNIRRLPVIIASAGVTLMLLVCRIVADRCPNALGSKCGLLNADNYMQIIISLSCAGQVIVLGFYLIWTIDFNRSGASPDVLQDEMVTSFLQTNSVSSDIGIRDGGLLDNVLERQADVIRYLKQHNEQLSMKILTLSEVNQTLKQGTV